MPRSTRSISQRTSRTFHTSADTPSQAVADTTSSIPNTSIPHIIADTSLKPGVKGKALAPVDPESDEEVPVTAAEVQDALSRPPPVNSDYLPLPWKGRLGYVSYPSIIRHIEQQTRDLMAICRLACVPISGMLLHQSLAPERVASPQYSRTDIP
jgi:hypothetical protein